MSQCAVTINARELAAHLAEERRPPARLLCACGQLQMEAKLPACLSLGVAGGDTSWRSLLMHLRQKAASPEASQELISDVATVDQAWGAIRPCFRRVRVPRQLQLWAGTGEFVKRSCLASTISQDSRGG